MAVDNRTIPAFVIEWLYPGYRRFKDILPVDLFEADGSSRIEHTCGTLRPKCLLTVRGRTAELDYLDAHCLRHNRKETVVLGRVLLEFAENGRHSIRRILWQAQGDKLVTVFDDDPCSLNEARWYRTSAPVLPPYTKPKGKPPRTNKGLSKDRKRQQAFRLKMLQAYSACVISECSDVNALDAAHIDEWVGPGSDHPQKGLVLRKDLHALFDAHLISIHPSTGRVHVSPRLRWYSSLKELKNRRLSKPRRGYEQWRPCKECLERHWKQFCKLTGDGGCPV